MSALGRAEQTGGTGKVDQAFGKNPSKPEKVVNKVRDAVKGD
jgi:hypothetical protein